MPSSQFSNLLSPMRVGPVTIRNRALFTGHDTLLQTDDGLVSDEYIAYQESRAMGGAGLQVLQAAAIDEFSCSGSKQIRLDRDEVIPGLRKIADAVHRHGGTVFAQLLQAGREIFESADGTLPVAYSSSATTGERYRVLPREMSKTMIQRVIRSYVEAARRALEAGLDGVEVVGNQGNLPAQFLAEAVNRRTDEYGGSLENRCRFAVEVCRALKEAVGDGLAVGLRLSVNEFENGVTEEESMALCRALDEAELVDFLSLVVGNQSTRGGAVHIVAPMSEKTGYVGDYTQRIKQAVRVPVMATGRFNTPNAAEEAIASGKADIIGMTRAMICDPDIIVKVERGKPEDVRACIGCLQACIGHYQKHAPVSCIQFPESGRELQYARYPAIDQPRKILVAGGGPAGMKAAAVAAERGHNVVLCEANAKLGGQVNLAQSLPTRTEFGGLTTNLEREMELAGVEVRRNVRVDRKLIEAERPDALVIATGGVPAGPDLQPLDGATYVLADDVIAGTASVGKRVVIADSRRDWIGIGVAEMLAANGHQVSLAVNGIQPGEFAPTYVRDAAMGRLFKAGVEVVSYARFFGADSDAAYFNHITAHEPIIFNDVDTVVLCFGAKADRQLEFEVDGLDLEIHMVGDCLTPRTAEEAVLEGLKVGVLL